MNRHTLAGLRAVVAAALAFVMLAMLAAAPAAAQSRYPQAPAMSPPPGVYVPAAPRRPSGPPWAMPNECYIDEGYGRFSPCR